MAGALWSSIIMLVLLCRLDQGRAYGISLLEQTITISGCNVSVSELLTVQPDPLENITIFQREIFLRSGWRFLTNPTSSTTAPDAVFATGDNTHIRIDFTNPPILPFNVSISYSFTNLIRSFIVNDSFENSLDWTVDPPSDANVTGQGVRFVAIFVNEHDVSAIVNSSALGSTTLANDTIFYYSQVELNSGAIIHIAFEWTSETACIVKIERRSLSAGAIVGIVIGTLIGTIVLLVLLNLACGYFAPQPPQRA